MQTNVNSIRQEAKSVCCLIGCVIQILYMVIVHMLQLLLSPIRHSLGLCLYFGLYIFIFKCFVDIQYYIKATNYWIGMYVVI